MKKSEKKYLTNPRKTDTIRISISYRSVPGKHGPEFVRSADLQRPPHKWHGFRILTHNPEVIGSNPVPATVSETTRNGRFWFKHAFFSNIVSILSIQSPATPALLPSTPYLFRYIQDNIENSDIQGVNIDIILTKIGGHINIEFWSRLCHARHL